MWTPEMQRAAEWHTPRIDSVVRRISRALILVAVLSCSFVAACVDGNSPRDEAAAGTNSVEVPRDVLECANAVNGEKSLFWGDLHIHTALSLDAFGFGTFATPSNAFDFAAGGEMDIGGKPVRLDRPLDFAAVTDHAEWLDILYICGEPTRSSHPYCQSLRAASGPATGMTVMQDFMFPTLNGEVPQLTPLCAENGAACEAAWRDQWKHVQASANEANQPCEFTAFVGYEWSATPGASHSHRNLIFKNENVTAQAIDYIRYPRLLDMFEQLDRQCRPEDDCEVVAIPHNTNMGDGVGFDIETDSDRLLQLRGRYERLVEIHQEKGNSECLSPFGSEASDDCEFELFFSSRSQPRSRADFSEQEWEKMRSTFVRSLLLRGLAAYEKEPDHGHEHDHGGDHQHPLQLGIIASTDTHTAAPGSVSEEAWQGTAFSFGSFDRAMSRVDFNPGGIAGVWATENTRESIFAALKRRETYGTSGPRIEVRFDASVGTDTFDCSSPTGDIVMGGEFANAEASPIFRMRVKADQNPLDRIEIIRGSVSRGEMQETRETIWSSEDGQSEACVIWRDPDYATGDPAFWYPRILEKPSKRWSAYQCEAEGRCDDYPEAVQQIQERAWGSPIWYLPN